MMTDKSLGLTLCDTQGQLFELAGKHGYSSEAFIKAFMTSQVCADMDSDFHRIQWAGKAYILSKIEEEQANMLIKVYKIYDKEVLYWAGYIYRYWSLYSGEKSREIYRQAPAKVMNSAYAMYRALSPKMTVERLKEAYKKSRTGDEKMK